ncbi:MAG: TolC family protein [Lacunisphaera sp.]
MKLLSFYLSFAVAASAAPLNPETLVAEIPATNPELQFYREELAAVRAGSRVAGSRAAPELAVELGRKRASDPAGLAAEGTVWSVSLAQTFDWPGRIDLRKSLANADVALAELGLARFEAVLRARVRTLAYGLHAAQAHAAAVREVADRYAALKEVSSPAIPPVSRRSLSSA